MVLRRNPSGNLAFRLKIRQRRINFCLFSQKTRDDPFFKVPIRGEVVQKAFRHIYASFYTNLGKFLMVSSDEIWNGTLIRVKLDFYV